jgi:hypothetical protein
VDKTSTKKGAATATDAADMIHTILKGLSGMDEADQQRVLSTVNAYFRYSPTALAPGTTTQGEGGGQGRAAGAGAGQQRTDQQFTPEEFLEEKRPQTDVERVVCLGYYIIVHRREQGFKTKDLTALNNEANQPKIGNPTEATKNAYKSHLLVQAGQGQRKLSTYGRKYVEALPDRDAARALKADLPKRRTRKRAASRKHTS